MGIVGIISHTDRPMKIDTIKQIKELIDEEVSLYGLWLRSVRRRAARHLPGLRSAEGDVRGGGGGLSHTPDSASVPIALPAPEKPKQVESPPAVEVDLKPPPLLTGASSAARLLEFGFSLAAAKHRMLMLDYDGTLAPFKPERLEALPYPGVTEAIAQIIAAGDRVVIISGRLANEVGALIGLSPLPEIWGCHGWERLSGSELKRLPLTQRQTEKLFKAGYALKNEGFQSRLEFKHGSLALHWRGASEREKSAILIAGLRAMEPATGNDVKLHRFDGGLELRAVGRDKGIVVLEILSSVDAGTPVAYLGDDLTDEDAFRALEKRGLGVLVRPEPRETAASVWLKPPQELIEFLELWLKSTGTGG